MEFCSLSLESLQALARQNLIYTYQELARPLGGVQMHEGPDFFGCYSRLDHSFCNFAMAINEESPDRCKALARGFGEHARARSSMRVFEVPGDVPEEFGQYLTPEGFRVGNVLSMMAGEGEDRPGDCDLQKIEDSVGRQYLARFMISQFFPASAVEFRQLVLKATSEAPHELWAVGSPENPIAAVMISSSPGSFGLYNLCIRSQDRSKGLGTQILEFMQHRAYLENRVLILQCDLNLETWYRARKFKKIGVMSSFYLRK